MGGSVGGKPGSGPGMMGGLGGGGKKADPGKAQLAQVLGTYNKAKAQQTLDLARSEAQGRAGVNDVKAGYQAAKKNIAGVGLAGKNQIVNQSKKTQAAIQSNEVGRGFGGGNAAMVQGRGAMADTGQALSQLDEQVAQMMAGLNTGEGTAVGGGKMSLAQLLSQHSGQKTDMASQIAQAIAGVQHTDPNAWMGQMAQMAGTAALFASDERLKRRFKLVGETPDGIPIWEFEYRSSLSSILPGRFRGVRAQEVRHIPGAVHTLSDGTMLVDYSMLPPEAKFQKVA